MSPRGAGAERSVPITPGGHAGRSGGSIVRDQFDLRLGDDRTRRIRQCRAARNTGEKRDGTAVDRIYTDLMSAGYTGQQPPYDGFMGARYAVAVDPDGNAVGLMSPIDPARRASPTPPGD